MEPAVEFAVAVKWESGEPMPCRRIPIYSLSEYLPPEHAACSIFVGRIEESLARRPSRARVHRHDHFELFWLEGAGAHFNDFQEYRLTGRSLVLVTPGQVHGWPRWQGLRGTMVGFQGGFCGDGNASPLIDLLDAKRTPVLRAGRDDARQLDRWMTLLAQECDARRPDWVNVARHVVPLVLLWRRRMLGKNASDGASSRRASELMRGFSAALEREISAAKTVADYARMVGVTPGHLNDTVRAHTGRSAGEVIRERVVLEARRLLLHSTLSVGEIAYQLGFEDPSYFARFFRRATRRAPREFRDAIRENYPVDRS